jgi:hypothetical protein
MSLCVVNRLSPLREVLESRIEGTWFSTAQRICYPLSLI